METLGKARLLSENQISRGRFQFQVLMDTQLKFRVMTEAHQDREMSKAEARGFAAAKMLVPVSLAKLIRGRSVSRKREEALKEKIRSDRVQTYRPYSSEGEIKPAPDFYDSSVSALDAAMDREEKRLSTNGEEKK